MIITNKGQEIACFTITYDQFFDMVEGTDDERRARWLWSVICDESDVDVNGDATPFGCFIENLIDCIE